MDFTSETNTPVAILSLDREKAFDCVYWAFLFRILANFGLGASFISWVKLLYTNNRSAVLVNGYRSEYFWPSRGVRQGCPLSSLLYVISIEVLAVNLRSHPNIIGLQIPFLFLFSSAMVFTNFSATIAIDLSSVPIILSRQALARLLLQKFKAVVVKAIQFVPVKIVHMNFDNCTTRDYYIHSEYIEREGVNCCIQAVGTQAQQVLIDHYPFEVVMPS